jgi:D-sedoheptulose 7-phosphate isomerase
MGPNFATDLLPVVYAEMDQYRQLASALIEGCVEDIVSASHLVAQVVSSRRRIFVAGNGGSSSQADHIAAEFVGRFRHDRNPYPAMSLATSTASLTAIGNDFGYEFVFERQLAAHGNSGDLLIALTTSGSSSNIIRLLETSSALGIHSITLTGSSTTRVRDISTVSISVPSSDTARIQEVHLLIGHILALIGEHILLTH